MTEKGLKWTQLERKEGEEVRRDQKKNPCFIRTLDLLLILWRFFVLSAPPRRPHAIIPVKNVKHILPIVMFATSQPPNIAIKAVDGYAFCRRGFVCSIIEEYSYLAG